MEAAAFTCGRRKIYVAVCREGMIRVPLEALAWYGISPGDRLLVLRGSGLAVGFAVRGPLVAEAAPYPELAVFLPT